jgi:hypothetical protein
MRNRGCRSAWPVHKRQGFAASSMLLAPEVVLLSRLPRSFALTAFPPENVVLRPGPNPLCTPHLTRLRPSIIFFGIVAFSLHRKSLLLFLH